MVIERTVVTERPLSAELLPVRSVAQEDVDRWRELAARAVEPNPSFEPEAVKAAGAHDPAWARAQLLVVRDGDRIAACVPLRSAPPRRDLPVPSITTRVDPSPVPLLPVLGTPLVARENLRPAVDCLLGALSSGALPWPGRPRPSVLVTERWNDRGAVADAWRAACRALGIPVVVEDGWDRAVLHREAGGGRPDWPAGLGTKRLADARRKRRRLEEHLGTPVSVVDRAAPAGPAPVAPETLSEALRAFVELEGSGWKGRAGTSLSATPDLASGFHDACRGWSEAGRLSLLTLESGGRPIAMRCAVRSGSGFFLYRIAYDEEFGRFGPGVLLELDTAEHFLALPGAELMDPCCAPSNAFYPDFLPDRLPVATALTGFLREGRLALAARPHLRRAAQAAGRLRSLARSSEQR